MRHVAFILVLLSFDVALAADQKGGTVVIKNIGILGPVTGSQDTGGRVDIEVTGPKIGALVIELRSSNQGIAAVPLTVTPTQGSAVFVVKTAPVTKPTDVTITAQVGASSKSAVLQILPPKLSALGCDYPANVIPQKPLKCTAWLDGLAAEAITVNLSTDLPVANVPPNVTIRRGEHKETFQVQAQPIAQSATVRVSATYAGVTKSAPLTVLPVALQSLALIQGTVVAGNPVQLMVTLTAPAPQSGLLVKFSSNASDQWLVALRDQTIKASNVEEGFSYQSYGVSSPTSMTITASSDLLTAGDARQVMLQLLPATLQSISIDPNHFANVPLGGQQAKVSLWLNGYACCGLGTPIDQVEIQYSGDTQITGPARVGFKYFNATDFTVTVSPCSVQQTCTVLVKARYHGKEMQASATVTK